MEAKERCGLDADGDENDDENDDGEPEDPGGGVLEGAAEAMKTQAARWRRTKDLAAL
jgi:hypothetical protein